MVDSAKDQLPKGTFSRGSQMQGILHILVAEDNRVNQRVISALLQKMGHIPVLVENGKAAIEALRNGNFDLILMDWQMPIMDGLEATSAIRAAEEGTKHHIPIIALTAFAMQGDREMCMAAGMDGYLPKPVSREALTRALDDIARMLAARPEPGNITYGEQLAKTKARY